MVLRSRFMHLNGFPTSNTWAPPETAWRIGVRLCDPDSFQHHPTGLDVINI